MELGSLNYRIAADTASLSRAERELDGFTDTAQRAEREVDSLGRSAKTAGSTTVASTTRMQRGFRDVQGAVERANSQLSSLDSIARGVAAGIAAIGFAQLGRDAYSAIAGSQQLQASLKTVTGSAEAASAAWNRLLQFAKETPYVLDQSVNAFIRMKSLGLDPTEEALRSFGNTASAMGKDLMSMIEAVADASTGEFERLKEFGIRASQQGDQVSFVFQGVTTTVAKNAQAITKYLESIGKTTFAGAMADQMDTLNGQMSNLEDGVYQLWLAVGDRGATDAFSGAIAQAAQAVDGLTGAINNGAFDWLFDAIGDINKQGDEFIKWVSQVHGEYTDTMNAIEAANLRPQASWVDLKAMAVQSFNGIVGGASEVINSGLIPIQKALNALDQTFANLLKNIGGALGPAGKQFLDWADDIEEGMIEPIGISIQRMGDYVSSAKEQSDALRQQADALDQAGEKADEISDSNDTVTRTTTTTTKSLQAAAKAASQFDDSLRGLLDRIDPLAKSQRDFLRDQALLQTALLSNKLTTEEYFRAVDQLSNSYENAGYWADEYGLKATSATQSVRDEADAMGVLWENTMERMDDAAVDMWRSFLDGSEDAFSSFKNLALDTLAEIIHAYTTQQITASLGLNIAGGGTRASGTGSMGGMGDIQDLASLGSKAWDYGSSLLGGGSSAGGLYANAATAGGLYSTAATGSAVTGGLYGSVATGGLAGSTSMLSSTMPYVGAAMLADQVLGLGIMDGVGGAISSLFGGGKKKFGISLGNQTRNEDGYSVDSLLGNVGLAADNSKRSDAEDWAPLIQQVAQAQDQVAQLLNEQQQSAVRSDLAGYMTYSLTSSDDLREEQVQNLMDSYMSEVIKSAVRNSGSAFADAIIAENSDNDAMYQELASALNLDTILDGLSDNVRDYADKVASETSGDVQAALDSVLASIQNYAVVSDAAKSLNLQFDALADGAIEASNALVEAAGGLETLQSLQSSYYSNFFSESEQAARLQQQLTDQFEALNMTLPASRDEFRAIVEGLDLATDSGRETYVAMLNLSDSFAQLTSDAAAAGNEISQAAKSLYSGGAMDVINGALGAYNLQTQSSQERIEQLEKEQKAIGTLSELMDSLLLSNQSILNPMERLQESQRQFAQLQVRAENGDTDAVSQLKGASSSYLDAAAAYYGQGSSQYAAIFGEVTDSVSGLEDQFSASLDGITDGNSIAGQQLAEQQRARQTLIDQLQTQIGMLDGINTFSDLLGALPVSIADQLEGIISSQGKYGQTLPDGTYTSDSGFSSSQKTINGLYKDIFDRNADESGLDYWTGQLGSGMSLSEIRDRMEDQAANGYFATGGAFTNGIVKRPTMFNMGVMGEAGPEAIMPLANAGGKLGVNIAGAVDIAPLVSELQALRQEVAMLRSENAQIGGQATQQRAEQIREQQRISKNTKTKVTTV